jgi:uncharacterized membrane protein
MAAHTSVQAHTNEDGQRLSLHHTSTDSPILPVENLKQLNEINPNLVQWVVKQTELEAQHRRKETAKINWFVLIEELAGMIFGAVVAIFGLGLGGYLILEGHDWAGVAISGVGLSTIVSILVARERDKKKPAPTKFLEAESDDPKE